MDKKTRIFQGICMVAALGTMTGAATIPFLFESPSLYYKLGMDKVLLQTGKVTGLLAAVLIFFQVILISRFGFLSQIFSLKTLVSAHRLSGKSILVLVLLHPFLIMAADNFVFFPLEKRYWPEFLGMGLLGLVVGIVAVSVRPSWFGISPKTGSRVHRCITPLAVALVFVHVFFVSESFDSGLPRIGLGITGCAALGLFARIYYHRFMGR